MHQYQDLLERILSDGVEKRDRTGTGTLSVFGHQMRFNLAAGFPMLTTKRLPLKAIVHELLWFLKGDTNVKYLRDNGVTIWDEWADARGELGPLYGYQWRSWPAPDERHVDQISQGLAEVRLSCQLYQRSPDIFLGVPFNIASYALLTLMVAQVSGLAPGEFVHTFGDAHLYLNHIEQARLQLSRAPRALPRMRLDPAVKDLFSFRY